VVAPFGVRGWVKVHSYADPPESLLQHRQWRLRAPGGSMGSEQERHVRQGQWDGHALRAALDGVETRDAAEALRDWEILIERAALPEVAPREYYREDLMGCTVRNTEGVVLGVLQDFLASPQSAVMLIKGEREYAVPAGPPHLRRVDLERREIEVDWPADF